MQTFKINVDVEEDNAIRSCVAIEVHGDEIEMTSWVANDEFIAGLLFEVAEFILDNIEGNENAQKRH